ncbi:helix-turn-helix transcriptional regulator [Corynebacterium tapiri]|uniref:WYL domain-containing protein n=1 Tax=Corynebacterium tapiri TaxID=1448266 RepID=A0A5C4U3D3_9CORY|nr:WYL domain-containing protein [Corynebacterium tapiri]TNL97614.1 WYL domain-containing protein [Corynebacterium tapiri]
MEQHNADILYRQTNLAFALLDDPRARSWEWIRTHVDGYQKLDRRTIQRDVQQLHEAGVPLVKRDGGVAIRHDDYELAPVRFTPAEATVVGLAGDLGRAGQLAAFARSGWTKLAAAGAQKNLELRDPYASFDDSTILDPATLTTVLKAIRRSRSVTLDYRRSPVDEPQRRSLDPWGFVPLSGRVYLVGFDLERDAPRSFRATKVSAVELSENPIQHPPVEDLFDVVRGSLSKARTDARLLVGEDYHDQFGPAVDGVVELRDVDREALIRAVASTDVDVTVNAPEDVKQDVIALLQEAVHD